MCEPCAGHDQHNEEEGYKREHGTKSKSVQVAMGNIPSGALSVQERRKKEGRSCVNGQAANRTRTGFSNAPHAQF